MAMEIRKSFCNICGNCPMNVWLKDGEILKVEAAGPFCSKGFVNKEYVYHEDRIKTPLRRVGKKGEGKFEEITWEEAYEEIAKHLLLAKEQFGAESVAFYTGHQKWYRPYFHRMIHSFGSPNYGTESSSCFQSGKMASQINGGFLAGPDIMNSDLFLAWPMNPFQGGNSKGNPYEDYLEKGGKIILVDPRVTPTAKFACLHLRPIPGTDGALALCFGNYLIEHDYIDKDYIDKYVYGFEEYKEYVKEFTVEKAAKITGISKKLIIEAAEMIGNARSMCLAGNSVGILHHINGMQNSRAIQALSALTGNFDREGGNLPQPGMVSGEARINWPEQPRILFKEFFEETRPKARPKIGSKRFPLWSEIVDEYQSMDLARAILEGTSTEYPIKAVFSLGLNHMMFPDGPRLLEALDKVEFFANADIFMTEACKHADIVLPACTSLERTDLQQAGKAIVYYEPAIPPLYQSKSDLDIIFDLVKYLKIDDPVLSKGEEYTYKYLLRKTGVSFAALKAAPGVPIPIPGLVPYFPGYSIEKGLPTPTGKYELYSKIIEQYHDEYGLEPLPKYVDSLGSKGKQAFPLIMVAGGRIPWQVHSRMQRIKSIKHLTPYPVVDIHPADAEKRGIKHDDEVELVTEKGKISAHANVTNIVLKGTVHIFQDFPEADANSIIDGDHLDPYSGFPGYRTVRCQVNKI